MAADARGVRGGVPGAAADAEPKGAGRDPAHGRHEGAHREQAVRGRPQAHVTDEVEYKSTFESNTFESTNEGRYLRRYEGIIISCFFLRSPYMNTSR